MRPPLDEARRRSSLGTWVRPRRDLPLAVLVICGCLLALGIYIHPGSATSERYLSTLPFVTTQGSGIDYYQFWIVGRAVRTMQPANIYADEPRRRMAALGHELADARGQSAPRLAASAAFRRDLVETFSTPFLYAAVNALAIGDYERDFDQYLNVCLACLILGLTALGILVGFSVAESVLYAAAVVLWCEPVDSDLAVGNVNQIQLGAIALYVAPRALPGRALADVASGVVLGCLVAFKPTLGTIPLLLGIAWIVDGRWRTLVVQGVAAIVTFSAAFVAGCVYLGSWTAWADWAIALPHIATLTDWSLRAGNFSLARAVREATTGAGGGGIDVAPVLVAVTLAAAGAMLFATRMRWVREGDPDQRDDGSGTQAARDARTRVARRARFERDAAATVSGAAISVVAFPLVWLHYYVLLLPLSLFLLRPRIRAESIAPAMAWMRLAVSLTLTLIVFGRPARWLWDLQDSSARVALYVAAAWLSTALGIWQLQAVKRDATVARSDAGMRSV